MEGVPFRTAGQAGLTSPRTPGGEDRPRRLNPSPSDCSGGRPMEIVANAQWRGHEVATEMTMMNWLRRFVAGFYEFMKLAYSEPPGS